MASGSSSHKTNCDKGTCRVQCGRCCGIADKRHQGRMSDLIKEHNVMKKFIEVARVARVHEVFQLGAGPKRRFCFHRRHKAEIKDKFGSPAHASGCFNQGPADEDGRPRRKSREIWGRSEGGSRHLQERRGGCCPCGSLRAPQIGCGQALMNCCTSPEPSQMTRATPSQT